MREKSLLCTTPESHIFPFSESCFLPDLEMCGPRIVTLSLFPPVGGHLQEFKQFSLDLHAASVLPSLLIRSEFDSARDDVCHPGSERRELVHFVTVAPCKRVLDRLPLVPINVAL